jgi:hypothetical protein
MFLMCVHCQESQAIKHDQLTRSLDNKATLQQLDTLKEGVALRDAAVNANFGTLDQRHSEVQVFPFCCLRFSCEFVSFCKCFEFAGNGATFV